MSITYREAALDRPAPPAIEPEPKPKPKPKPKSVAPVAAENKETK